MAHWRLAWLLVPLFVLSVSTAQAGQVILDVASGKVVAGKNESALRFPASITKLMTALVALDAVAAGEIAWNAPLKISKTAASAPPVKLGLRAGSTIRMNTAIHAILTRSSNDAARVIAEAVSGSEGNFARRMNATARKIGMTSTTFRNASGLPDRGHLTTALDLARMIVVLDKRHGKRLRPLFRAPFSWNGRSLGPRNGTVASPGGSVLGKTGFTCDAGFTAAVLLQRGGRKTAIVTLGNPRKAIRAQSIARLARGQLPAVDVRGAPPVVIPRDVCNRARKAKPQRPGGWMISLGNFRTKSEASKALAKAKKAGISFQGQVVTRDNRDGYHALLFAPSREAARKAERPLRGERLRTRILPPEKVDQAEFEPD